MLRVSFMNKMFVVNAVIVTALDLGIESLASIKRSKRSEELMNQIYY
jgi:hypothetical protein